MKIIRTIQAMHRHAAELRRLDRTIGLIPTMGAFHNGHLTLVRRARQQCDAIVVSIFVNPYQFGPHEGYDQYPHSFLSDSRALKKVGTDILFAPPVSQMYPQGFKTWVSVKELGDPLEGKSRPGHFTGVATIVLKLLNIVQPHTAYFGRKDYQQTLVIRRMVRDLNQGTRIVLCPTVREPDGLAMSSRNRNLSARERRAAAVLWQGLQAGRAAIRQGECDIQKVLSVIRQRIRNEPLAKIDYISMVNPETLEEIKETRGHVLLALAIKIGQTRLIDNLTVKSH